MFIEDRTNREVICTRCLEPVSGQVPDISPLGFEKYWCPVCGAAVYYPLRGWLLVQPWILVLLSFSLGFNLPLLLLGAIILRNNDHIKRGVAEARGQLQERLRGDIAGG